MRGRRAAVAQHYPLQLPAAGARRSEPFGRSGAQILFEERRHVFRWKRRAKEISLELLAAVVLEEAQLLLRFDALGNHL